MNRQEVILCEELRENLEQAIKLKENEISLLTGQYPGDIPRGENINLQIDLKRLYLFDAESEKAIYN